MSAAKALQQAIFDALRADAPLRALLAPDPASGSPSEGAIYDHVPEHVEAENPAAFPYVAIGDDTGAEFDTDDQDGMETTVTLHIWDRYRGRKRVKEIQDAIYNALHDASLSVSGQHTVFCYWEFSASVPDPERLTQHQVTRFRIVTQEQ